MILVSIVLTAINSIIYNDDSDEDWRDDDFPTNCKAYDESNDATFCSMVSLDLCISYKREFKNGKE